MDEIDEKELRTKIDDLEWEIKQLKEDFQELKDNLVNNDVIKVSEYD